MIQLELIIHPFTVWLVIEPWNNSGGCIHPKIVKNAKVKKEDLPGYFVFYGKLRFLQNIGILKLVSDVMLHHPHLLTEHTLSCSFTTGSILLF